MFVHVHAHRRSGGPPWLDGRQLRICEVEVAVAHGRPIVYDRWFLMAGRRDQKVQDFLHSLEHRKVLHCGGGAALVSVVLPFASI